MISVFLGTASGLATAANSVRNLFHDDIKDATAFEKHFEDRQRRLDAIELKNYSKASDYWKASIKEKVEIQDELNDLAHQFRGVRKGGIFGTLDRFQTLSPRSRGQLYFNGTVGAVIGAAMTLSFFNGVATRDKIDKIGEAVTDKKR
ncbi:MAG: hypothetical protein K2X09_03825 [Rickettsiales bacterium]|nr:hypothetical protein [Rickettsiales bacterium]